MFSNWFLKSFRVLLLPFALLFGIVVWLRNWLYDMQLMKSYSFGLPIINVGNLSVGGTGKSPMVEYLVRNFKGRYRLATLSRGYKRKTKGYALASENTTSLDIGDEPMLFYTKFPEVPVAIGEQRLEAIPQLLHDHPETQVIILDDAFQHRKIKAGLNILLTDYENLFTRDFFLPTGDLRDMRSSYKRAEVIVVTKCPPGLGLEEKHQLIAEINPVPGQKIFFSAIAYGTPYHLTNKNFYFLDDHTDVLLVTGIANPRPLKKHLEDRIATYNMMTYNDHHIFSIDDWRDIQQKFAQMDAPKKIILTTEKDAMRLLKFRNEVNGIPFYVMPIEHRFLFNEEHQFENTVLNFVENFKKPVHGKEKLEENKQEATRQHR